MRLLILVIFTQRGELKRLINDISSEALNRKDPDPVEDDIDMANHSIINLKDPQPSDASYAASVNFVNNTVNGSNVIINGIIDKKYKNQKKDLFKQYSKKMFSKKLW